MTRTGKIARLPRQIREQLNRRIEDGEPGVKAVEWLNEQPEVRAVLKAEFADREVSEQNLSEWKRGGYPEWLKQQEDLALARELAENADELTQVTGESFADMVSPLLAARYVALLRTLGTVTGENGEDWKVLRELCGDLVALRKGDHSAERLKLERERLRLGIKG
jgi:hypothetical protein